MKYNKDELDSIFDLIRELNDVDFDYVQFVDHVIEHTRNSDGKYVEGRKFTIIFENYEDKIPGKYLHKIWYGRNEAERRGEIRLPAAGGGNKWEHLRKPLS